MGVDESCGGKWTAWAGVAVMGSLPHWCGGGIPLDVEEEVVAVCWYCTGVGGFRDPLEAGGLASQCDFVPPEPAIVDCPFWWQVSRPVAVGGGAVLRGGFNLGNGGCEGLLVAVFLCGWWGRRFGHIIVRSPPGHRFW